MLFLKIDVRSLNSLQNGAAGIPHCPNIGPIGGPDAAVLAFNCKYMILFKKDRSFPNLKSLYIE